METVSRAGKTRAQTVAQSGPSGPLSFVIMPVSTWRPLALEEVLRTEQTISRSEHGTLDIRGEKQKAQERGRRGRRLDGHGLSSRRQQSRWCRCCRSARDEKSRLQ